MPLARLTPQELSRRYQEIMDRLVAGSVDSVGHAERELDLLKLDADDARLPFLRPSRAALMEHVARSARSPSADLGIDSEAVYDDDPSETLSEDDGS